MSIICRKCLRFICLANRVNNNSNVCPLLNRLFNNNLIEIKLFKTIWTTNKSNVCLNNKLLNSIQSKDYSNEVRNSQNCWKCGHHSHQSSQSKVLLFCDKCHSIQAIDRSKNYFDLFEQKVSFDLDLNKLNEKFKSLQMLTHPDKYGMSSDRELKYSMDNSSVVNTAYKTLRDPYERGLYLLKLSNTLIEENESIGESAIDSKFLTNIMELNEDIEENRESKEKLLNIFNENKKKMIETTEQISKAFDSQNIIIAKELLSNFKFLITLDSNLKQMLEMFD